jgi:hypothetical protein
VPLDLASPASVREAAARIVAAHPRVDILVNNAGVMAILERRTVEGLEMQLGVNHLGHFALTALLLPALLESDDARVVSVTSTGRHSGRPIDPENPHLEGRYEPWRAYGQSKLAKRALCARARAAVPGGGRAGKEHRGAPGVREHRLAGRGACARPAAAAANASSGTPSCGSACRRLGVRSRFSGRRIRTPSVARSARRGG